MDDTRNKKVKAKLFRIHVAGDFYDIEYTKKWLKIVQECRETTFYAYTRSWCIDEIRPWLNKLAEKTNFRMWFSCDRSMKEPFRSKNVRLAYMQVEKDDKPAYQVDLVFRIKSLRKNIQKKVDSILVCPPENGVSSKVTCESCGWCWKPLAQDVNIKETKRVPLLVVK